MKFRDSLGKFIKIFNGENKCIICGKSFSKRKSETIKNFKKRKYCSQECFHKTMIGDNNPSKRIDVKEKISKKLKGNKSRSGHKMSNEAKKKISEKNSGKNNGMYGKTKTNEQKEHLRKTMTGDKNPSWKGGITKLNKQIRSCFKYRQWRSDVFTRDDFICQGCSKRGGNLEAHHIKQFATIIDENNIKTIDDALNCQELWNINNGQTLCIDCHNKTKK